MMQISNLSFPEAEYEYLRGLHPKIRDLIRTKDNISEIRELQLACFRLDSQHEKRYRNRDTEEALVTTNSTSTQSYSGDKNSTSGRGKSRDRGRGRGRGRGRSRGGI